MDSPKDSKANMQASKIQEMASGNRRSMAQYLYAF